MLYIDGPFLILETAVNALLAYAVFTQSLDRGELDVIGTEVERCLTGNSYVYWLVRGDLKFFTHSPFEATNLALVKEYASYGLIIPFCIVFAKLMKGRYSASVWLNMVIAVAAYAIVVNAVNYALDRAQQSIYARSSCAETAARSAFATYNSGVVTRQIGERVNRQLRNNLGTNSPSLTVQGTGFAVNLQLRSSETPEETIKALSTASRSLYCANNTDMRLARAISLPLNLTIHEAGGPKVVYQEQIVPATCTIPP